jgi:DNA-binding transcriptional MerR regulator/methylmalonyl-CoA mutase cobalamin-binding subunit
MLLRTSPDSQPPLHPMRVVTRRTGLSADLLRAWERRYEVVKPLRSESGRRLYSDTDIERLGLLYRATLAGRSIGQLARLSTPELAALVRVDVAADRTGNGTPQSDRTAQADRLAGYLDDSLRAVERLDPVALDASLRRALVALPADAFLDTLIVLLLERIGTRWREGTLRPMHGHLASTIVRRVLDRIIETAAATAAPNLLVATPAGQLHEFGAMLTAATAASEGWRVTYLGASLSAEDIAATAEQTHARAIALSIVYPEGDRAVAHELRRLGTLLPKGVALLAGGAASVSYRPALEAIGATLLGDLTALRSQLGALRRRRRPMTRDLGVAR